MHLRTSSSETGNRREKQPLSAGIGVDWGSPDNILPCGAKPLVLHGFPSSIYSVTAKQEKVVGTALELSSSGSLCLINECHVPCLEQGCWHCGMWRITAKVIPVTIGAGPAVNWPSLSGGAACFRVPLFAFGLLYDYGALQLLQDVVACLSVYKQVKLVLSF